MRGILPKILLLLVVAEAAAIAFPYAKRRALPPEESQVARGARAAQAAGCFACHGEGGAGHRPNPGSKDGEVPGFTGGTPMMYASNDQEIREYIEEGMPAKHRGDAAYQAVRDRELLRMPAYGKRLAPDDVAALVAFIKAVSGLDTPDSGDAAKAFDLAVANNCFGCHGAMGAGGVSNPGSLKGYIPGYTGNDFAELVRDDEDLRAWIRTGTVPRLEKNPVARAFLQGEAIHMPAFEKRLTPAQIDGLVALLHWLRDPAAAGSVRR